MISKKSYFFVSFLILLVFLVCSSVSASEYIVDFDTSLDDIHDWMNNTAKKGDKLVFTGNSYVLNDTLVVNKPIIIGSRENTVLTINKKKTMIDIQTNAVNLVGLSLIHTNYPGRDNNDESIGTISTSTRKNSYIKFNMKNTKITTITAAITINIQGNIINSYIKSDDRCISSNYWKGHLYKSNLRGRSGIVKASLPETKWKGNCINSNIIVEQLPLYTSYYKGTIYKSKIYSTSDLHCIALSALSGKFTINRSIIRSQSDTAILIGKNKKQVKIIKSKIIPAKGYPKYKIIKYHD